MTTSPLLAQTPPPPPTDENNTDGPPPVTPERNTETPPPPPPTISYYVVVSGQQQGPFDQNALVAMIKSGKLTAKTRVWTKGMADWQRAEAVTEMAELLKEHASAPPPPVAAFMIVEGGAQAGPFTIAQLKERAKAGTFNSQTLVWKKGMANWTPAGEVAELADIVRAAAPPPPKDAKPFMLGRWQMNPVQMPVEGASPGMLRGIADYRPDGTYEIRLVLEFTQGGVNYRRTVTNTGTFTAKYANATAITISAKGTRTNQLFAITTGKSAAPQVEKIDESFTIKVVDQNTVGEGNDIWRRVAQ